MMGTYKLAPDFMGQNNLVVIRSDGACIPPDPDNTDYAQFKKDILDGVELLDADGQVMDAIQFVNTLP